MRQDHMEVFWRAASESTCWVGLREPNPLGDRWIHQPKASPKPESCKAKTADNPRFPLAGLVVDPNLPDAFKNEQSKERAMRSWREWSCSYGNPLPPGFKLDDKGVVLLNGRRMFSDYDLMALVLSDAQGRMLPTTLAQETALFEKVQRRINSDIGVEMIQHGSEMMWDKGVGAKASELVLWFGPGKRFKQWPSSMPIGKDQAH